MNNYDEQNQQQQNARPIQNAQANSYQHSNQHQNGSNNNAMPANQYQQANYPQGGTSTLLTINVNRTLVKIRDRLHQLTSLLLSAF